MEYKLRFGLVLGQMAILKTKLGYYEQLLRAFFSCFHGQKKYDVKSMLHEYFDMNSKNIWSKCFMHSGGGML